MFSFSPKRGKMEQEGRTRHASQNHVGETMKQVHRKHKTGDTKLQRPAGRGVLMDFILQEKIIISSSALCDELICAFISGHTRTNQSSLQHHVHPAKLSLLLTALTKSVSKSCGELGDSASSDLCSYSKDKGCKKLYQSALSVALSTKMIILSVLSSSFVDLPFSCLLCSCKRDS